MVINELLSLISAGKYDKALSFIEANLDTYTQPRQLKIWEARIYEILGEYDKSLSKMRPNCRSYLDPIKEIVLDRKRSPGEEILELWQGPWKEDPDKLMRYLCQPESISEL